MRNPTRKIEEINTGTQSTYTVEEQQHYCNLSKQTAIGMFDRLKTEREVFQNENYFDFAWVFVHRFGYEKNRVSFAETKFINEVKCYVLLWLQDGIQPEYAKKICTILLRFLKVTDDLSSGLVDSQIDELFFIEDVHIISGFLEFIEFEPKKTRRIINKLNECSKANTYLPRPLPTIQSYMLFDNIISDYVKKHFVEYPRFQTMVLWWKLSTIIPLRPIEFASLKTRDFYEDSGTTYVHIDRSLKSDPLDKKAHSIPLVKRYVITKELYKLFEGYMDRLEKKDNCTYLFNPEFFEFSADYELVSPSYLNGILHEFFDEIVHKIYGFDVVPKDELDILPDNTIEFINLGDTRHYAFQNMIISGFNPYTIAQIGGHRDLQSQMSYYSGTTSFCVSKAYTLSLRKDSFFNPNIHIPVAFRRNAIVPSDTHDVSKLRSIGNNNYCTSMNFPHDCVTSNCENGECPYMICNNSAVLHERLDEYKKTLDQKISVLKSLVYREPHESSNRFGVITDINSVIRKYATVLRNINMIKGEGD